MTRLISLAASKSGSEVFSTVNAGLDFKTRVPVLCVIGRCIAEFIFAILGGEMNVDYEILLIAER